MRNEYICKICSGEFKDLKDLRKSMEGMMVTADMYECPQCHRVYGSGAYSSSHLYIKEDHNE